MILIERLRKLRNDNNLTQKECAEQLGVELSNYNKWENGISPNLETLCIIAKFYNVTSDYLLGLSNIPYTDSRHDEYCRRLIAENAMLERKLSDIKNILK